MFHTGKLLCCFSPTTKSHWVVFFIYSHSLFFSKKLHAKANTIHSIQRFWAPIFIMYWASCLSYNKTNEYILFWFYSFTLYYFDCLLKIGLSHQIFFTNKNIHSIIHRGIETPDDHICNNTKLNLWLYCV